MWNSITGRNTERSPYDGTGLSLPCATNLHAACRDTNCSCVDGDCTHARARAK